MPKIFSTILFLFALASQSFGGANAPLPEYTPGTLIIKLKSENSAASLSKSAASSIIASFGATEIDRLFDNPRDSKSAIKLSDFYLAKFSDDADLLSLAGEMTQSERIEYAQPDYLVPVLAVPNDPDFSNQPFWQQIMAPQAWDVTRGDSNVVIAILDTGVDWDHPDLADDIWTNENEIPDDGIDNDGNGKIDDVRGWDFVNNASSVANGEDGDEEDNDPSDFNGHGTHVAGLAAAVTDNGVGVAGGGWNCEIMPLRVGYQTQNGTGSIQTSAVLKAIQYSVDNGASVINASFGGPFDDFAERDMMRYAFDNGVVVVKAAGNANSDISYSPDDEDFILSVASVKDNDQKARYSNYGVWVKIAAPGGNAGVGLRSTYPDDRYASIWGTSMASPVVAGIAGLVKSVHPDWSAAQIMMHIVDTADNIDAVNSNYVGQLGKKGRINAWRAVSEPFASQPEFEIAKVSIQDLLHGANGDQRVNIGETADILIRLLNRWNDAENVSLELTTTDPFVEILQDRAFFETAPGIASKINYVENITDMFTIKVDSTAFPHNMNFQLHITADGGFFQSIDFQIALEARILFVDDDDGVRNVEQYYFDVLDSLGMPYDVWDYATQGRVGSVLRRYDIVLWNCENALPTLTSNDRNDILTFLRYKRHLFIAGQNIGWDLCAPQTSEEAQSQNYFNQYNHSGGKSKTFYENYLHTQFVKDKSSYSFVQGLENEPIGAGLEFAVAEPLRQPGEQSPDVISPGQKAKIVFEYPNGEAAAIRHENNGAKLVNFGFGGIEAIADDGDRFEVMQRLISYFTGIQLAVLGVDNIEEVTGDFIVRAAVAADDPLQGVYLYWRTLDDDRFTKIKMTTEDDSIYTAAIPRQPFGAQLEYGVQAVKTSGVYSPIKINYLKVESTAPAVAAVDQRLTNLNRRPYVLMTAEDNSGIDTTSAKVIFWSTTSETDSLALDYLGDRYYFGGEISGDFAFGDTLYYQFVVNDLSPAAIRGVSSVYKMLLGHENFESGLDAWHVADDEWGLNSVRSRSGDYSIHETGDNATMYPNNADLAITLQNGLDLSRIGQATLSMWMMYGFADDDVGYVEASNDSGATWTPLGLPISGTAPTFYKAEFALDSFTGPGNENVLLRFRLVSNEAGAGPGWYIDDISLLPVHTGVMARESTLPLEFRLEDNYPNPFNAGTSIRFALPRETKVDLAVYNTLGQKVISLANGKMPAGVHAVVWNGLDGNGQPAPSGLYFYRIVAGDFRAVKKLTMIK